MNVKKLAIVASLLLFLIGCAQTNSNTINASATPVIDRIQQRGMLTVGMTGNMPPLNMTSKEGELMGYEVDLARAMAKAMGVKAELKTMPFAELLPALETGKIDMILSKMNGNYRKNIKTGLLVRIVQKHHQRSGELTEGFVKRLLTSAEQHPHGIKVQLSTGEVGRVKEILEE